MDPQKPVDTIDLSPHEWRSERDQPHEPFFGPGLPTAVAWLIGFAASTTISYYLRLFD